MIIRHLTLVISIVSIFALTISCSSDDDNPKNATLEGLWKITEEKVVHDNLENPTPTIFPQQGMQPYIRFNNNDYFYYEENEARDTIKIDKGTYSVSHDTLTITLNETPQKWNFRISGNKIDIVKTGAPGTEITVFGEKTTPPATEAPNNNEEEEEDEEENEDSESTTTDFETLHDNTQPEGSHINPKSVLINQTTRNNNLLFYTDSLNTNGCRYYIKIDANQTYNITLENVSVDYSNISSNLMKYLQVWVTDVFEPVEGIHQKKEFRVRENETTKSVEFISTTGYIYVEVFRYKTGQASFDLIIEKATIQD